MWSIIMISIREVLVYKRTFFGDQLLSSFSPSSFSVTRALLPTFKLHSATYCTGARSVHTKTFSLQYIDNRNMYYMYSVSKLVE